MVPAVVDRNPLRSVFSSSPAMLGAPGEWGAEVDWGDALPRERFVAVVSVAHMTYGVLYVSCFRDGGLVLDHDPLAQSSSRRAVEQELWRIVDGDAAQILGMTSGWIFGDLTLEVLDQPVRRRAVPD